MGRFHHTVYTLKDATKELNSRGYTPRGTHKIIGYKAFGFQIALVRRTANSPVETM